MMKLKNLILAILAVVLMSNDIKAQDESTFSIKALLRSRAEYVNGYKILPTENSTPGVFVAQRTRLTMNYNNKVMTVKLSMQDVGAWGNDDLINGTGMWGNSTIFAPQVYEAWAEYKMNPDMSLRIGRQELAYGNQRLLCARGWSHYGMTYDAAVFKFNKSGLTLDFGLTLNNQTELTKAVEYPANQMKTMAFLYVTKKINDQLKVSLINVASGYQETNTTNTIQVKNTVGPNIDFDNKTLSAHAEAYFQMGKTVTGQDVSANFFGLEAGYKIGKIKLSAGVDYMSGQDQTVADEYQAFDLLYGARFKFYGMLNHYVTAGSTKNGGLMNPFMKIKFMPNKQNTVTVDYHMFQLAQDVADANGDNYDKALGSELNITYNRVLAKGVSVKLGYSMGMPSETLEIFKSVGAGNATTPQWGWVMFTFKPSLLTVKK